MSKTVNPPFLGSAYYPEDWNIEEIDKDVEKMVEAGMNVARIGEFAWRKMEPKEGCFDFEWLHTVVDKLAAAGIKTIMGTPTATPPIWLSQKHPDVMAESEAGRSANHGGRRHCCSNNTHYREYSAKIVEAMAKEFGKDDNILGWQIDNEIYFYGSGCYCPSCQKEFAKYLEKKYGTIEKLNEAWNLNLFSQAYDAFHEIPAPRDAWHNPHLKLEWLLFQSGSHINFIHMQAEILKKYTAAPIGTDMMPYNGLDYEKMNEALDVVQFNHYNTRENLWTIMFWYDFLRTLKQRPFWNTETSTCWNGSTDIGQNFKPEGFCRINSWLPIALGGEANLYWLWRTHWAGHELMHGSVLSPSGRPMHIYGEVHQTAEDYKKAADFINNTEVKSRIALHFTSLNWNMFAAQSLVHNLRYKDVLCDHIYKPFISKGHRPDIIGAKHSLEEYDVLVSSCMLTLEEEDLQNRISEWVKEGGTWIVGPMTDVRNSIGARYTHSPFGMLEELTGVRCLYQIPDSQGYLKAAWKDGSPFEGNIWFDVFEADEDSLADLTESHSSLTGKSIVMKKKVGKGIVILLGTIPSAGDMEKIIDIACKEKGISGYEHKGDITIVPRQSKDKKGLILAECGGNQASCNIPKPMRDILSGKSFSGTIELRPYDIFILQE